MRTQVSTHQGHRITAEVSSCTENAKVSSRTKQQSWKQMNIHTQVLRGWRTRRTPRPAHTRSNKAGSRCSHTRRCGEHGVHGEHQQNKFLHAHTQPWGEQRHVRTAAPGPAGIANRACWPNKVDVEVSSCTQCTNDGGLRSSRSATQASRELAKQK